jgi:PII-like signaling protein
MKPEENSVLKIYASTTDKVDHKLLYEHIVLKAREQGISGVTVYRGIMGYGSSSKDISTSKFWELTEKLPVMIEIIDTTESIMRFYDLIKDDLDSMKKGCLVTIEPVRILMNKSGRKQRQ